jgi:hypothetical protein
MSLTKVTLMDVVKKQYFYKLKAFSGVYTSLVVLQIIAFLFSLTAFSQFGSGSEDISVSVNFYSVDPVIGFTMLWAFITAIIVTTKAYRNDDFTFVTNRLSSDLSNFAFLFTVSIISASTALLSSFLLKVVLYFLPNYQAFYYTSLLTSPGVLLLGIITTFLYIFLCASFGYMIGTFVQLHSIIKTLLPVLFFGMLFFGGMIGQVNIIPAIAEFFFMESSIWLFFLKIIVTVFLMLASSVWIFRRVEVRQ